jgi:hypothetical protein
MAAPSKTQSISTLKNLPQKDLANSLALSGLLKTVQDDPVSSNLHGAILLNVGCHATFLSFGSSWPARLSLGWMNLDWQSLDNESSTELSKAVQENRDAILDCLTTHAGKVIHNVALGRRVLLAESPFHQKLLSLQAASSVFRSKNSLYSGMNADFLRCMLTKAGLAWISHHTDASEFYPLISYALILSALSSFFAIEWFEACYPLQPEAAMLTHMQRLQAIVHHEFLADSLHIDLLASYNQNLRALRQLFPDFKDQIEGRVKDVDSITHKLNSILHPGNREPVESVEDAASLLNDGHGFTIALKESSRANIILIRNALLEAIETGCILVHAVKNYRGPNIDCPPYFDEFDISLLNTAIQNNKNADTLIEPELSSVIIKDSGYTTTQLNLLIKNPETGYYDLPEIDLHICGEKVYDFYKGADHLIYDCRVGKDLAKHNSYIRAQILIEAKPLLEAIQDISEEQFQRFTAYRQKIYTYLRRLELGEEHLNPPELPAELPDCCHLNNLTRLSNLQRALIREAAKHSNGLNHSLPKN